MRWRTTFTLELPRDADHPRGRRARRWPSGSATRPGAASCCCACPRSSPTPCSTPARPPTMTVRRSAGPAHRRGAGRRPHPARPPPALHHRHHRPRAAHPRRPHGALGHASERTRQGRLVRLRPGGCLVSADRHRWLRVRLLGLPVEVHRQSGEHQEALRREMAFIEHAQAADAAPARLHAAHRGAGRPVRRAHRGAGPPAPRRGGGRRVAPSTWSFELPPEIVDATVQLGDLLDGAGRLLPRGRPAHPRHPAACWSPTGGGCSARSSGRSATAARRSRGRRRRRRRAGRHPSAPHRCRRRRPCRVDDDLDLATVPRPSPAARRPHRPGRHPHHRRPVRRATSSTPPASACSSPPTAGSSSSGAAS